MSATRVGIVLMWLMTLMNTTTYTIVMPTSFSYCEKLGVPDFVAGLLVGLFPLSKALMNRPSNVFIERYGLKAYMLLTGLTGLLGNVLYAVAQAADSYYMALGGRFLAGSCGGQLLCGTFTARFPDKERSSIMLVMQSAQVLSYVLGPFLGGLFNSEWGYLDRSNVFFNGDTAPGWFMAAFALMLSSASVWLFDDEHAKQPNPDAAVRDDGDKLKPGTASEATPWGRLAIAYLVVFTSPTILGAWELHTIEFAQKSWGWTISDAGYFLAACMLPSFPVTLYGSRRVKVFEDRIVIRVMTVALLPFILFMLGPVLGPSSQQTRQISFYAFSSCGFVVILQIAGGVSKSLCTKMVPKANQQDAVGVMALVSAIGRTVGPVLSSLVPQYQAWACVILALAVFQAMIIATPFGYKALEPYSKEKADSHTANAKAENDARTPAFSSMPMGPEPSRPTHASEPREAEPKDLEVV